ncbi:hypothetical protein M422DRAFT_778340 [Sphaerobolus stellatus SS14]|uniref:DUF6533 domain-containing protein n=1 Tax=Sphaerobolus stellatus (strain SS14) TaxID=990650 RepID=A0A0C9VI26_SPHS4|nr:hypothetical protein M422DRAFT_778340 [Sphaerobolus stellatus SS14]
MDDLFSGEYFYRHLKSRNYANISAIVLLIYDTLLTSGDEIAFVWRRKFGLGSTLYLLARYCGFPGLCVGFAYNTRNFDGRAELFEKLFLMTTFSFNLIVAIATHVLLIVGAYAISGGKQTTSVVLRILLAGYSGLILHPLYLECGNQRKLKGVYVLAGLNNSLKNTVSVLLICRFTLELRKFNEHIQTVPSLHVDSETRLGIREHLNSLNGTIMEEFEGLDSERLDHRSWVRIDFEYSFSTLVSLFAYYHRSIWTATFLKRLQVLVEVIILVSSSKLSKSNIQVQDLRTDMTLIPTEILQHILYHSFPPVSQGLDGPEDMQPPFEKDPVAYQEQLATTYPLRFERNRSPTSLRQGSLEIQADRFVKGPQIKLQFEEKGKYDGVDDCIRQPDYRDDKLIKDDDAQFLAVMDAISFGRISLDYLPQLEYLLTNLLESCADNLYSSQVQRNTGPISVPKLKVANLPLLTAWIWESITPATVSSLTNLPVAFYWDDPIHILRATQLLEVCRNLEVFS